MSAAAYEGHRADVAHGMGRQCLVALVSGLLYKQSFALAPDGDSDSVDVQCAGGCGGGNDPSVGGSGGAVALRGGGRHDTREEKREESVVCALPFDAAPAGALIRWKSWEDN
jgi:hypothetical protein